MDEELGLAGDTIQVLHLDQSGRAWVGTKLNFYRFAQDTFLPLLPLLTNDEEAESGVYSIAEEGPERWWIGRSDGIYRFNPEVPQPALLDPRPPSALFAGYGHLWRLPDGQFWAIRKADSVLVYGRMQQGNLVELHEVEANERFLLSGVFVESFTTVSTKLPADDASFNFNMTSRS